MQSNINLTGTLLPFLYFECLENKIAVYCENIGLKFLYFSVFLLFSNSSVNFQQENITLLVTKKNEILNLNLNLII